MCIWSYFRPKIFAFFHRIPKLFSGLCLTSVSRRCCSDPPPFLLTHHSHSHSRQSAAHHHCRCLRCHRRPRTEGKEGAMNRAGANKPADDQTKLKKLLDELTKREENKFCADCGCRGTYTVSHSGNSVVELHLALTQRGGAPIRRAAMGVHQPRRVHLHRVLGHPPQSRRPLDVCALREPRLVDERPSGGACVRHVFA